MHVHLPKPLHGWRQFVGEVGVIVLGVLIALAAEQAVEAWHWHNQAERARRTLRVELGEDNLPQAYARLALEPCLRRQLNAIQLALNTGAERTQLSALARNYRPPIRTWDDQAWDAVVSTGDLAHGGSDEIVGWAAPYRMVARLGRRGDAEQEDLSNLRSIGIAPGPLTETERDRVTVALEHLVARGIGMAEGSRVLISAAHGVGVDLTREQERQVLDQLRPDWGACVVTPNPKPVDIYGQSEAQFEQR